MPFLQFWRHVGGTLPSADDSSPTQLRGDAPASVPHLCTYLIPSQTGAGRLPAGTRRRWPGPGHTQLLSGEGGRASSALQRSQEYPGHSGVKHLLWEELPNCRSCGGRATHATSSKLRRRSSLLKQPGKARAVSVDMPEHQPKSVTISCHVALKRLVKGCEVEVL